MSRNILQAGEDSAIDEMVASSQYEARKEKKLETDDGMMAMTVAESFAAPKKHAQLRIAGEIVAKKVNRRRRLSILVAF